MLKTGKVVIADPKDEVYTTESNLLSGSSAAGGLQLVWPGKDGYVTAYQDER